MKKARATALAFFIGKGCNYNPNFIKYFTIGKDVVHSFLPTSYISKANATFIGKGF